MPKFKERGEKGQKVIEGLKKSFVFLCKEMKSQIESGEYDAIVSDDTGGRIPTLLFRKILKLVNPKHDFKTLFVATGSNYKPKSPEEQAELEKYLKRGLGNSRKVLVVSQYIHGGGTLARLADDLRKIGIQQIDISAICANAPREEISALTRCDRLFIDTIRDKRQFGFSEDHNILSGVAKQKGYNPMPIRLDRAVDEGERKRTEYMLVREFDELFGVDSHDNYDTKRDKYLRGESVAEELDLVSLSTEEKTTIQDNIKMTRESIRKIAEEIVFEVWGISK